MADVAKKYAPINFNFNGGSLISYLKTNFSFLKPKKTVFFAYSFIFISIASTIFLAFTPTLNTCTSTSLSRSHFSTILYYIFPAHQNTTTQDEFFKASHTTISTSASLVAAKDFHNDLLNCDLYDGSWVRDDSYPLYKPGSCSLIDQQFNCFLNGRPDTHYFKLKWKPKACTLPRLNGRHMLEVLRGKRLVFVGDSLNRNMWESLICILRNSVEDENKVYEVSGMQSFRSKASYAFAFQEYKCTVEFFMCPFLVQEWEAINAENGRKKETLRLDLISTFADKYKDADIILFNTGHWWTHEKTSKGEDYYQEGSHVYGELNVVEAFRRAMRTWGRWIDANVNPTKSLVIFRGYSASHFSGGQWNGGGQCENETEPIKNDGYLSEYPEKMRVVEEVLRGMKAEVRYMNVTRMTDYRKDGHPSIYRNHKEDSSSFQDCSHWCLPGVPDAWNEILYAELLLKMKQHSHSHSHSHSPLHRYDHRLINNSLHV